MAEALADYHAQYPLRPGLGREELKSRLQGREKWPAKLFNELLARGVAEGLVEEAGDILRRPGFQITFTAEQQAKVDAAAGRLPAPALHARPRWPKPSPGRCRNRQRA